MATHKFLVAIENTSRRLATSMLAFAAYSKNAWKKKHPLSTLRRPNDGLNDRHQYQILLGNWAGLIFRWRHSTAKLTLVIDICSYIRNGFIIAPARSFQIRFVYTKQERFTVVDFQPPNTGLVRGQGPGAIKELPLPL